MAPTTLPNSALIPEGYASVAATKQGLDSRFQPVRPIRNAPRHPAAVFSMAVRAKLLVDHWHESDACNDRDDEL